MIPRATLLNALPTSWNSSTNVCSRCLFRLSRLSASHARNSSSSTRNAATPRISRQRVPQRTFFAANSIRDRSGHNIYAPLWNHFFTNQSLFRSNASTTVASATSDHNPWDSSPTTTTTTTSPPYPPSPPQPLSPLVPPHRRRLQPSPTIPPDASSQLSSLSSTHPPHSLKRTLTSLLSLSKPRLSFLMVLTTAASYSLYPTPALLSTTILSSATNPIPSLSALTLLHLTLGTALCSASANTLNMLLEPLHDAKMSRTRTRPLVRGLISKRSAFLFALATATLGVGGLYYGVNPTVAVLGGMNIVLYAGIYTPLKRISVLNTWVGAIVGGIPPLMGWGAAAGQYSTTGTWQELLLGAENVGGWLLAGLLFAWQFPHFNALSWSIREEYKNAGYRMLCWVNPARNGRVAVRYAVLMLPICWGLSWVGVTDWGFVVSSTVVNGWVVREAVRFWRWKGQRGSARGLFWAGVWQLPILMVLGMGHKRGLWEGVWERVFGEEEEEEEEEVEEVLAVEGEREQLSVKATA